ncbi:MAG: alpha/beta hydrolase [Acidimicrobiales bacterium]
MPITKANGIDLFYETVGDVNDPTLLLVHGFTAQIVSWEEGFVRALADRGFHVVTYDNRDVGHSTHFDGVHVNLRSVAAAVRAGEDAGALVPYTLSDMGADGVALLDVVGAERAHVAGVSMGGMIAQTIAIEHPDRTRSLASIMSTTGELAYGRATDEANAAILSAPAAEREAYIAQSLEHWKIWASRYHGGAEALTERLGRQYDRMFYPEGATRQLGAIIASGERSKGLSALEMPTVVIHGRQDTLIQPSGGERTAELVPGSRLLMLDGMGHDLPAPLWPAIIDAIVANAERSAA